MHALLLAVQASINLKPVLILVGAIAFILLAIVKFRLHAFLALACGSILVAVVSADSLPGMLSNIRLVSEKFGQTAGGIGLVVALAAIIGMCLTESRAADAVVTRFIRLFGEKRASWALLISGFVLSIPVFFDTVLFLLIPLARVLGQRTGRDYMLYLMALAGGGVITHSMVPPTPGPLLVCEILGLDIGVVIVAGTLAGLVPAMLALYYAKHLNRKIPLPVRETAESTGSTTVAPDRNMPSFGVSILPVLLPVVLIASFSFLDMVEKAEIGKGVEQQLSEKGVVIQDEFVKELRSAQAQPQNYSWLHGLMGLLGDKVIALGIGALIAIGILVSRSRLTWKEFGAKCAQPLELAGVIILITSAGGSFGALIGNAGIGEVIIQFAEAFNINYVFLAWFVTAIIRIAQGSGTVSMITGAGLMAAVLASLTASGETLDYHPLYIFLAVGFGSITSSWMNDSGFWILAKLSGMTERETLRSWTTLLTVISFIGLAQTLLLSWLLPLAGDQ